MRELWHTRRGQILAGGTALLLILLLLMFLTPKKEHASEESDIAFLRINETREKQKLALDSGSIG